MADFGDIDDFNDQAVQGKPIKAYPNGHFDNPKTLFVQHHWTWDEFLCAASQRLEMVPTASRVFNADGAEIDDIMCIEENDMLFFSAGRSFKAPSSSGDDASGNGDTRTDEKFAQVVGGYKVTSLLGRGGFGEVRLGIHQLTNDRVALKFILKSEMGSLGDVERTTTEIQCLTALNHPSIIKLLRVINEPNHVVLVFELLDGGDLFHYLKSMPSGGLPESEGTNLFSQILAGVGYAHNQHICHRDLKLENILLPNKMDITNVKIADFGLSDFYKPGAMMKTSCGSISYLAPEVFRGTSNAGPPLDVWSLGVILFAIVCGRLPFEGSDLHGSNRPRENVIRNRIMRCQYKIDDHLSPALHDLLLRLLKPDPNERATIPEIFSHPWVRGGACGGAGSLSADMAGFTVRDGTPMDDEDLGDDDDDDENGFTIAFGGGGDSTGAGNTGGGGSVAAAGKSPAPAPLSASLAASLAAEDDKLPSIVQRIPSRLEALPGVPTSPPGNGLVHPLGGHGHGGHGGATAPPTGTPTNGRSRPGRIMEHALPGGKHGSGSGASSGAGSGNGSGSGSGSAGSKADRVSPRTPGGGTNGGIMTSGAGGALVNSLKPTLSPTHASFKRMANANGGSSRSRQRPHPHPHPHAHAHQNGGGTGIAGGGGGGGPSATTTSAGGGGDRERAHMGGVDMEKLPVTHQKSRRRSEHPLLAGGEDTGSTDHGSHGLRHGGADSIGKKHPHGGVSLPATD